MIKNITYEYIWKNIIQKSIFKIWNEISDEDKVEFRVTKKEDLLVKEDVFKEYTQIKERLKKLYHFDDGDPERRIDIHKIASCFAQVLIEYKVFAFEYKEDLKDEIFFMNAKLAYDVSISFIYLNLVYTYLKKENSEIVRKLLSQKKLMFPETTQGHDEYNVGRYKTIALNDVFGNEFDILTYSDMMYWIEFYNRQILESNITPQLM